MIIKELDLGHFGKFRDSHVSLTPGLNIVYGKNEAGKSTLHAFIRGMLFGIERARGRVSKEDLYTKYEPWDAPGSYHGSMVISIGEEEYRIIRSFYKKEKRLQVISVKTGRIVATTEAELAVLLRGLSDSVYSNTISIGQLKAKTDQELADELKKYITNLSMSKSSEVDVTRAIAFLSDQKKQLEKSLPTEQLKILQESIESEQASIDHCEHLYDELKMLSEELDNIEKKRMKFNDVSSKEKLAKLAMAPAIEEKYRQFKETVARIAYYEERSESVEDKAKHQASDFDHSIEIQKHLTELQELRQEKQRLEEELRVKKIELEQGHTPKKINAKTIGILNVFLGILAIILPLPNPVLRCTAGVIIMFLGIIQYTYKANRDEHDHKIKEDIEKEYERQIFQLHSKRHDILLSHRVTNETQLVLKYNDVVKNELEREQLKERRIEYLGHIKELKDKKEQLEYDIINYMKYFINRPEACDSCMEELRMVSEEFYEEITIGESKYQLRYDEIKSQMERIRWTLESKQDQDEKLRLDQEEWKQLTNQKDSLLREIEAITMSIQTLKELSLSIHDTFGARLNELISETISKISNGEYQEVTVDENLNIRVLQKNRYITIDNLSAGTMDQMYLSLRFGVAQLLFSEDKLPIVLDDAFALYDDERTYSALSFLAEQKNRQIILFTCHNREHDLVTAMEIPANIIKL